MSTTPPAAGGQSGPQLFKDQDEFAAFLKRVVVEETGPEIEKALAPLTEKQSNLMKEMLELQQRAESRGEESKWPKGYLFARQTRAMALAYTETRQKGDIDAAIHSVKRYWSDDDPVLKGLEASKKLKAVGSQVGTPDSLGNLIRPEWSTEIIELLTNRATIRGLSGVRVIPNPTGSLSLRRETADGIAYWVGQGQVILPSKPGVGLMNFLRKKLASLSVLSNDLLRTPGIQADQFVLNSLLRAMRLAEDLAFLRGAGTEHSPKGIRNLVAAANVFAQTGTTLAAIDADFSKAVRLVEEANVDLSPENSHWLLIPRSFWALWNAAPATDAGARPYREELKEMSLLGYPVHKTNQIPKNLGGGSESETYFVHGPSLMIADTLNIQVDIFPGGAYSDGTTVFSGISQDETPIRVLRETDFNMSHQEGASVVTGVTIA